MLREGLIIRDRIEEFMAFRRAARRQHEWFSQPDGAASSSASQHHHETSGDGSVPLSGHADEASSGAAAAPPPWVRVMQSFTDLEVTVLHRFEALHNVQREFFAPKFISADDEEEQQKELETMAADAQKLLKELERLVLTGVKPADANNSDEVLAARNVQRHLSSRLTVCLNAFRDGQQLFMDQLKKREAKVKKFRQIGSVEVQEKLEREEKIANYLELGYAVADIQELLLEDARQQEVSNEVQNVLNSIKELHDMFKDLHGIVVEQGTVLDRIDFNIQKTRDNTSAGLKELKKAREHQKRCTIQ